MACDPMHSPSVKPSLGKQLAVAMACACVHSATHSSTWQAGKNVCDMPPRPTLQLVRRALVVMPMLSAHLNCSSVGQRFSDPGQTNSRSR